MPTNLPYSTILYTNSKTIKKISPHTWRSHQTPPTLFRKIHPPPPTTRDTIPMPSAVSATPGATIDGDASPGSPRASHDAFVLTEDEALAPEVARRGESVLRASLVAGGWGKWRPGQEVQMAGRCD